MPIDEPGPGRPRNEVVTELATSGASWAGERVCIVGAGYMGTGIGQVLALAGADRVVLVDTDAGRARAAVERTVAEAASFEREELLPPGAADLIADRTSAGDDLPASAAAATLVVEAVFEDPAVKVPVLRDIARAAAPDAVITTNTSAIPIRQLAGALPDPSRFLGLHWFNPPQFVPGVEVIPGPDTADGIAPRLVELLRRAGKWPAVVPDTSGFVCNRLQFALFREAAMMVEEGLATPEAIDEVVRGSFGFRLPFYGPFMIADMAGLDVYAGAYQALEEAYGPRFSCPPSLAAKVAAGEYGAKTGSGYTVRGSHWSSDQALHRNRSYRRLQRIADDGAAPDAG